MSVFYITDSKSKIYVSGGRIIVKTDEHENSMPVSTVESLVVVGGASLSSKTIHYMLTNSIPVLWLSKHGKFYGKLDNTSNVNAKRQREQTRCADNMKFCREIVGKIIFGKISNQIILLRRYNRDRDNTEVEEKIGKMVILKKKIADCTSKEEIMGYEGICARYYFECLSLLVDEEFSFTGRNRRPPKDEFNSLLSVGYTFMMYEVYTAITIRGLNPYIAFMHSDRVNHPTLASDLMEEWRPIIVDSLVLSLINKKSITKEHFSREENGGVYLNREGLNMFIERFEKRIRRNHKYTQADFSIDFRQSVLEQVTLLCKAIENADADLYQPIIIR